MRRIRKDIRGFREMDTDLYGNKLSKTEEFYIIYEGPSFDGRIEVPYLIAQLKSTEKIINEVIREIYKEKKLGSPENIKIYLKLKKSSFQEIITVILNHPLTIGIVGGCIVVLFDRLLKNKENSNCIINIENLTQNYNFAKEMRSIVAPLQSQGDKVKISILSNLQSEVSFDEKEIIEDILKQLQKEILIEIVEDEFIGYLYYINRDKETLGFTLEDTNKHVPVTFINPISLHELKNIFFEDKLKITANATSRNKELHKLEIKDYKIIKRKTLKEYYEGKS